MASKTQRKNRQGVVADPSRSGGLKRICFNARSVTGKADELRTWINTWNYGIITITATWLREGQDWQLNVPGYKCFKRDRGGCKRGGCVALLVKDNITPVLWEDTSEG